MADKEFEMDQVFRVPEARDALPPERQVLLRVFEQALNSYSDIEAVKRLALVEFVNYLSALELMTQLNQQVDLVMRQNIALQLERRELLGRALERETALVEKEETIDSLARQMVDLAKELEDLQQDW